MKTNIILAGLLVFSLYVLGLESVVFAGQVLTIQPPNVTGWPKVETFKIHIIPVRDRKCFLGRSVTYENTDIKREYVMVLERFPPYCDEPRKKLRNTILRPLVGQEKLEEENTASETRFNQAMRDSESFLYIKWRVVDDSAGSRELLDKNIESWILGGWGLWSYSPSGWISTESVSEFSVENWRNPIVVGRKYTLSGDKSHILMISQKDDLFGEKEN